VTLEVLIDEIEAEAVRDRRVRRALGGVWASVEDDALARRLAAVTEPESESSDHRAVSRPEGG
jgi:hypothetical protein